MWRWMERHVEVLSPVRDSSFEMFVTEHSVAGQRTRPRGGERGPSAAPCFAPFDSPAGRLVCWVRCPFTRTVPKRKYLQP